ncbi:ABC-type transport auxiliary lipoprotein family protein [Variovorax sp. J22R133]|uniref:ABC-type transport auxiliary lipoprotein family protein n=1 Tax=Variovorax brevis TaxID=3053503 RepID=UPI00257633A4|nr:ABC-type transport auxiliary lipoprotein family protein [Variovorax sp. J22R133]MDM0116373.1 ABC-type transport auxiliary lipoprotein family protein [Variovorax sp. J22R133]
MASCIAACVLAGCASGPALLLVTLPSIESPAASAASTAAPPGLLLVRRLDIPEYLMVQRMRYRSTDDSTLAEWPHAMWAERIEVGITREFKNALRQRLPGWQVCEANCGERGPVLALQVMRIDFVRSERRLYAAVRLSLWTMDRPPRPLRTEEHAYVLEGDADSPQPHARTVSAFLARAASDAALAVVVPAIRR